MNWNKQIQKKKKKKQQQKKNKKNNNNNKKNNNNKQTKKTSTSKRFWIPRESAWLSGSRMEVKRIKTEPWFFQNVW